MRVMGIQALYPKPHTNIPAPSHASYPYVLTNLNITKPNQVWGTDITYIPGVDTWYYLVAILDWYSRYVVSWQLSSTLDSAFCITTLQQSLHTYFHTYNHDRLHSALQYKTPAEVYVASAATKKPKIDLCQQKTTLYNAFRDEFMGQAEALIS